MDSLTVQPDKGELDPKGRVQLVFTLTQKEQPSFWEGEMTCKVQWRSQGSMAQPLNESILNTGGCKAEILSKAVGRQSIDNQIEGVPGRRDIVFLRVKKSSDLSVR